MPRIPQNLRERVIGLLNVGMTMNAFAMNIGCSTRAIRHLRQRLQATRRTEDRPRRDVCASRRLAKTHIRNRFQTATATAAKKPYICLNCTQSGACARVSYVHVVHMLVMFWRDVYV